MQFAFLPLYPDSNICLLATKSKPFKDLYPSSSLSIYLSFPLVLYSVSLRRPLSLVVWQIGGTVQAKDSPLLLLNIQSQREPPQREISERAQSGVWGPTAGALHSWEENIN